MGAHALLWLIPEERIRMEGALIWGGEAVVPWRGC